MNEVTFNSNEVKSFLMFIIIIVILVSTLNDTQFANFIYHLT